MRIPIVEGLAVDDLEAGAGVAHEPPLIELLDDRETLRAATQDYCAACLRGDVVGAWTQFFEVADIDIPADVVAQMFGGDRDPQQVADERFWFAHELRPSTFWQPELRQLAASPIRIVVGIGEESTAQICDRTSRALADVLGVEPVMFPGGHIGFVDDPDAFAPRLRAVLHAG